MAVVRKNRRYNFLHPKALVLNADYSAIGLTKWNKALKLQNKNVAHTVDFYRDDYVTTPRGAKVPCPAVIALTKYVHCKKRVPYSRQYIYIRDRLTCQYCGNKFHHSQLTLDHVIPRSKHVKGITPTRWENIVTCCRKCNTKKSDFLIDDIPDMELLKTPVEPSPHNIVLGLAPWTNLRRQWVDYLPKYYLDLLEY